MQKTKVTDGIHTSVLAGYHIFTPDALIWQREGVTIFYWDAPYL